jgi:arylsulfatase A-like enzyme
MPTILQLLEINLDKKYENLDGESLVNQINGQESLENIAYSETGNPLEEKEPPEQPNTKSVRTSKWKLIFNEHNNTKELYDLENDPNEEENLIGKNLEIKNKLWEKLVKISNNLP